jgi:hypothetical protein
LVGNKRSSSFFVLQVLQLGWRNDCNSSEILEGIGERVGVCYHCGRTADEFVTHDDWFGSTSICHACFSKMED